MRLPPLAARLTPRLIAALLVWAAASKLYPAILSMLHPLLGLVLPAYLASLLDSTVPLLVALTVLAGSYTLAALLIGVPAALALPLGVRLSVYIPVAVIAVLVAVVVERRLAILSQSGMRASRTCRRILCHSSIAGNAVIAVVAGYAAYLLSSSLGSAVGSYMQSLASRAPPLLQPILAILSTLYIVRLLMFAATAWVLYKAFTTIAEPVVYAVLASPADAAVIVEGLVEAERVKLEKGEAWHQKLLRSSISAVFALVSIPLLYGGIDALVAAIPSLSSNPLISSILYMLYAASPIVSLIVYMVSRRVLNRLASSLAAFRLPRPSARPAIALAVLATLLAVLLAGVEPTIRMLVSTLSCPFTGSCAPMEPPRLLTLGSMLRGVFAKAAADAAGIVRLINALVSQAFQG